MAYLAGEARFSPQLMPRIKAMLVSDIDRVGGCGIKIHPDFWYANLYHWLFGDTHLWRGNVGIPFPLPKFPYPQNANQR
jgi:hypothetical protein